MNTKLLTEQHLEFLNLKGSCTVLSESTLVKMPYCWKSHFSAQMPSSGFESNLCMLNSIAIDLSVTAHRDCTVGLYCPYPPRGGGGGGGGGGTLIISYNI